MDKAMLIYLAELANYESDAIDTEAFFSRYPRATSSKELYSLQKQGFVTLISSDDRISEIGINQKLIDYVKKTSS